MKEDMYVSETSVIEGSSLRMCSVDCGMIPQENLFDKVNVDFLYSSPFCPRCIVNSDGSDSTRAGEN